MLNIGKLIRSDFTKGSDYLEDLVIALDGLDATIQEILSSSKIITTVFEYANKAMSPALSANCGTQRSSPNLWEFQGVRDPWK